MRAVLYDYISASTQSVRAETDTAIARGEELVARAIGSRDEPSLEGTLAPVELAVAEIGAAYGRGAFLAQVHPDAALRDVAQAADEQLTKWRVGLAFRRGLYEAVRALAETDQARSLTAEPRRLLEHWLRDFRRAGQELDEPQRTELEQLQGRLVELEVAFQRNINEHRDWIEVTREQLSGLPDDYVARLSSGEQPSTYRVTLDSPDLEPFMRQAHDRSLREELFRKNWNRAVETNRPLLAEALRIRQRIAGILGQPTWAHHALEVKMAARPERVEAFYADLLPALRRSAARELAAMGQLLANDAGPDASVATWDWRYYDNRLRVERYGVDPDLVSEYMPLHRVIEGMFELAGEVFGLAFQRVPDARAWHETVELYEVRDRASDRLLAHFYTDLFPREGKFNHAAAFPLVVGHRRADGSYAQPVTALVTNFTPPSVDRPSLLRHGEVKTLFHEFGHVLHMSLTTAEFARFSAANTEWDFVEAPSQIMEHWTWDADLLGRFARHYRTGEPIPRELVDRLVAARQLNAAVHTSIQAFYGTLDLAIHDGNPEPDMDAALRLTYGVTGFPYPEGTFMLSGFGHLMGGYDAGYYGYLWAEVIGDDMFSRFVEEGVTSPQVGDEYRRKVLEPNGTLSGDELVRSFLGRDPTPETFLRLNGLLDGE